MQWSDEGIVLSVKPHGETAAVVDLWTRAHGRHLGLVHGGRSRRLRPVLQAGNHVDAAWKARLADQLGSMSIEMRRAFAAEALDDAPALMALSTITTLTRLLPERDPHPNLYEITLFVLGFLNDATVWPALLVRWELALLDELGFGLDLSQCACRFRVGGRALSRQAPGTSPIFDQAAFGTGDGARRQSRVRVDRVFHRETSFAPARSNIAADASASSRTARSLRPELSEGDGNSVGCR